MGIRYPEIIEHQGEVIIMYNNGIPPTGVPPGEWFVRSKDGGKTWSPQIRAFHQHVGRNGDISFVVDSKGSLHVLFGNRIPITVNGVYDAIGGIWHSELLGNSWSEPDAIIAMTHDAIQAYTLENPNNPDFAPFNARAVISQGNVLLVTWMTDPGLPGNGVWYSYKILDTPKLAVTALPTAGDTQSSLILGTTSQPAETPIVASEAIASDFDKTKPISINNSSTALYLGIIPVAIVIVFALIVTQLPRFKHL